MRDEIDKEAIAADDFTYQFGLSVAVVRHLQLDPLLPAELIPRNGRDRICAAPTVASTKCSSND